MFNRRSFLALIGLSPLMAATAQAVSPNELSVTEVLPTIPTQLKQTPVQPGSLKIAVSEDSRQWGWTPPKIYQDDGDGCLRDPGQVPRNLLKCQVVGRINYIDGRLELWQITPQGSVATYQSWG